MGCVPNPSGPAEGLQANAVVAVDVVLFTLRPAPDIANAWQVLLVRSDDLNLVPGGGIVGIEWVPVRRVAPESLAFDHVDMLRVATHRIQSKLRYSWVAFQLLPETFSLPELRAVYAAILDPSLLRLNTSNFKKAFAALFASGALVPVGQRAAVGRVGRPAELYAFAGSLVGTWERELPWHERSQPDVSI